MCSRVSGLGSPDTALSSLSMKTTLSSAYVQSRAALAPGTFSKLSNLRTWAAAEIIQGFNTSRCLRQRRCHSLGHSLAACFDEVNKVGFSSIEPNICVPVGGHGVGVMLQDSSEAQCATGDESSKDEHGKDHLKDQVRDELAGEERSLRSDIPEGSNVASSSLETQDVRVEELTKVVQSLSQSLLFFIGRLETVVRQKESPSASREGSPGVDGRRVEVLRPLISEKDPENPRSRVASRKRLQSTGRLGRRRQNVKLDEDIGAMKGVREDDLQFMGAALAEAKKAAMAGEVPVGAVIVQKGKIIARAYNRVESAGDPTAHAEMLCLRSAARHHGNWRLGDATLYVTLEPCPMCAGAILQSRVKGVVWGSRNTLLGADGSWVSLFPEVVEDVLDVDSKSEQEPCNRPSTHPFHTSLEVRRGVLAEECSTVMRAFFKARREVNRSSIKTKPWWLPLPAWVLFKRLLQWLPFLKRV